MTTAVWMVAGSLLCWLVVLAVAGGRAGTETLFGMIGPAASAGITMVLAERTYRRDATRLTSVMAAAFAGKMVFFGAYVVVMLRVLSLRPVPFIVSFTSFFIALHLIEALALRRLFAGDPGGLR